MNKKILIPVISGVVIVIILMTVLVSTNQKPNEKPINDKPITEPIPIRTTTNETAIANNTAAPTNETAIANNTAAPITPINLSYADSNSVMKSSLAVKGIPMSSALKISGGSIAKYCTFYGDTEKQNSIEYCTSTELKDSDGKFLGNIHMVGSLAYPNAVLGVIQTDPYMSNLDDIKTIYQVMVESLVCDCWQDQKPGNLESISAWVDTARSHHLEATGTTSSSKITGLAQKQLLLEVTTNTEGYLWKFIISN